MGVSAMTDTATTDDGLEVGADIEQAPPASIDPGSVEGQTWFDRTMAQAEVLAASEIVPVQYRGRPADIVVAAMYGRDFGWSPTTAMSNIQVIEGRPSLSAQAMVALVRHHGHALDGETSSTAAKVTGMRSDTGDSMTFEFTVWDAARAGLCTVDDNGVTQARTSRGKPLPWETYPASMCWARAVSQLCRMLFPDVLMSVSYTPEEVESFSSAPRQRGGGAARSTTPAAAAPPPTAEVTVLKARIAALRGQCGLLDEAHHDQWLEWRDTNGFDVSNGRVAEDRIGDAEAKVAELLVDQGVEPFGNVETVDGELIDDDDRPGEEPPAGADEVVAEIVDEDAG